MEVNSVGVSTRLPGGGWLSAGILRGGLGRFMFVEANGREKCLGASLDARRDARFELREELLFLPAGAVRQDFVAQKNPTLVEGDAVGGPSLEQHHHVKDELGRHH